MNTPSSKSLINEEQKISLWRMFLLSATTLVLLIFFWRLGDFKQDPFIDETYDYEKDGK